VVDWRRDLERRSRGREEGADFRGGGRNRRRRIGEKGGEGRVGDWDFGRCSVGVFGFKKLGKKRKT
jgi:hypothetical protein